VDPTDGRRFVPVCMEDDEPIVVGGRITTELLVKLEVMV
jgi:hypothetical protein